MYLFCVNFLIGHLPPFSPDSILCIPSQMQRVSRLHFHFIRNIPPFVSTNTFSFLSVDSLWHCDYLNATNRFSSLIIPSFSTPFRATENASPCFYWP